MFKLRELKKIGVNFYSSFMDVCGCEEIMHAVLHVSKDFNHPK